jgi:hypothetical protein
VPVEVASPHEIASPNGIAASKKFDVFHVVTLLDTSVNEAVCDVPPDVNHNDAATITSPLVTLLANAF